jgi:hypothetical protein
MAWIPGLSDGDGRAWQEAEAVGEAEEGGVEADLLALWQHVAGDRIHEVCEREVRDLPCFEYTTTVVVETTG